MEVVLEGTEGVPEGGVLSIKVGDTKRQAPVSRVGQPFRFASSPAEPLPLKVELLMPVSPAQIVYIDPVVEHFVVTFGEGRKVMLQQREVQELQRPLVDIGGAAEARGLPAEKLQVAQKAATYLEEHDLVRTFQDILHGLLVTKPMDPHAYVEERLARAKKLAAKKKGEEVKPVPPKQREELPALDEQARAKRSSKHKPPHDGVRKSQRGTEVTRNKVDLLLQTLHTCNDNLPLVLPLLPMEFRDMLESKELQSECRAQFVQLDKEKRGRLLPTELLPVLMQLSSAKSQSIGTDQCRRFVEMFDTNEDGQLDPEEFTTLVQFVIVAGYLESEEGKQKTETARLEADAFKSFIEMIEADKERLWSIIPFLPEWLVEHVTCENFQSACNDHFNTLDADRSGVLEPEELFSIIQTLSEAHPMVIDLGKCKRFTTIFDTHGDEGREISHRIDVEQKRKDLQGASERTAKSIVKLQESPSNMREVIHALPQALVNEITSKVFVATCTEGFKRLDKAGNGIVDPIELFPIICELCKPHPFHVDATQCKVYLNLYDKEKNGFVSLDEFVNFAKYCVALAYLGYAKDHQEMLISEIYLGQDKISQLMQILGKGVDQLQEVVPFLPQELIEEIRSPTFERLCEADFKNLDKADRGALGPKELVPVILELSNVHHYSLTADHCKHFIEIFDVAGNGVITHDEYLNFVRFMMIMAFLETEEGQLITFDMEVARGKHSVEELLHLLEKDRQSIHKILPLLPTEVCDELTSENFVMLCHERFVHLDKDKTGVLRPHELYPVVLELSAAHPYSVTEDQCKRFTTIFDLHGDGVLRPDEFLDFIRFLCIMSYLHTQDGKNATGDALQIMADSKRVDELIAAMHKDKQHLNKVIPYLPSHLRDEILSEQFTVECVKFFSDLDKDGNKFLDPAELFPLILTISKTHHLSLDMDQCKRFTEIFDDAKNGVISRSEFVNFARFLIVMSYLHSEGREVLNMALNNTDEIPARPGEPCPETNAARRGQQQSPQQHQPNSRLESHLEVDLKYYQNKSEKLSSENGALRERLASLEMLVRRMEEKLEDQGQRLRHAEVDLRASGKVFR